MKGEHHLAPWESSHQFDDSIFQLQNHQEQESHEEKEEKVENQIIAEEKPEIVKSWPKKIRFQYQSVSLPKRQKHFTHILPKVYDKPHHDAQFIVIRKQSKRPQQFHSHHPTPLYKNELIIAVPNEHQQLLPKIHPEHPIRHSKQLKLQSEHHEGKYQSDDLTHLMKRFRKNSAEIDHNTHNIKKLSAYQEQIIKKCSLKNLEVFERKEKVQTQPKKAQKHQTGHLEKHILDKILTKLD